MERSAVPVEDLGRANQLIEAAEAGAIADARTLLEGIEVPRYRALALAAIASHERDHDAALADWLRALCFARRAGRDVVEEVYPSGRAILQQLGRADDAKDLREQLRALEVARVRAQLERESAGPVTAITLQRLLKRMRVTEAALSVTRGEVESAWAHGGRGHRLLALLATSLRPELVNVAMLGDVLATPTLSPEWGIALQVAFSSDLSDDELTILEERVELPASDSYLCAAFDETNLAMELQYELVDSDEVIVGLIAQTNATMFMVEDLEFNELVDVDITSQTVCARGTCSITGEPDPERVYFGHRIWAELEVVWTYSDGGWRYDDWFVVDAGIDDS